MVRSRDSVTSRYDIPMSLKESGLFKNIEIVSINELFAHGFAIQLYLQCLLLNMIENRRTKNFGPFKTLEIF